MSRRALRERERAQSQATVEPLTPEPPSFRVRDYSPEGLGSQFSTTGVVDDSVAPAAASPAPQPPAVEERTLTRRELRALREAAERESTVMVEAAPEPAVVPQQPAAVHQPVAPAPVAPQPAAFAQPVQQPVAPAPPELVEPVATDSDRQQAQWQRAQWQQAESNSSVPQPTVAPPLVAQPPAPQPPVVQQPPVAQPEWAREPEPAPDVVVVPTESLMPPAPEFDLPVDAPVESLGRPVGHWSRQADLDDQTQLDDILPGRDLSRSDAITTSALVLPSMPDNPIGPLSSTGEILVTGSIELPRMLGATGVHPARFDHSEVDSIIDASDREDSHPNSSPVRAIRAVSTHTSTQGIIAAKRPRSKLPTYILAGVATVMGAGVVVLFVGGMLLDLF